MLLDFEVQRCTRRCVASDRQLEPGETVYSVLEAKGSEIIRQDYSSDAWKGPPETAFAWWKFQIPEPNTKQAQLAPNEVLLDLFDQLTQSESEDMRYVLTLLLVRRRVFRLEDSNDTLVLIVTCPRQEETYQVPVATLTDTRLEEIQQQLGKLLYTDS